MKNKIKSLWKAFKVRIKPYLNVRFLLCFGIGYMITNGWCYVFMFVGKFANIGWMLKVGLSYYAFLWLPFTQEKIVTIAIAMFLHKIMFPKDYETIKQLQELRKQEKEKRKKKKHAKES